MPLPGPPLEPHQSSHQPSVVHIKRIRQPETPEGKVLIAANEIDKHKEVTITGRHYKFAIPEDWEIYDDSYKPTADTGPMPGTVDIQFVAPQGAAVSINFIYRGRPMSKETGSVFNQILSAHKDLARAQLLTPAQIKKLAPVYGSFVGENQYVGEGSDPNRSRFKMTACKTITIGANAPALSVEGEWRNEPKEGSKADSYWREIYIDGGMDARIIHELRMTSATKEGFESHKAMFEQFLKNIRW